MDTLRSASVQAYIEDFSKQHGAIFINNRNRYENVVGGAIPGWGRGREATNPRIRLRTVHDQLNPSSTSGEPFDFCFS